MDGVVEVIRVVVMFQTFQKFFIAVFVEITDQFGNTWHLTNMEENDEKALPFGYIPMDSDGYKRFALLLIRRRW